MRRPARNEIPVIASLLALTATVSFSSAAPAAGTNFAAAFTPGYSGAFIIAPNIESASGPYFLELAGAGLDTLGGGTTMQVGFAAGAWYMRFTRGPSADYIYDPLYSPPGATIAGPPDLTDRNQLPPEVLAGLDPEFDIGRLPRMVAWFEWARYLDVPLVFHLNGGPNWGEGWPQANCVPYWLEQQDKLFCMWNENDLIDPDDDASTFDMPAGDERSFATLSYASDSVAESMGITLLHRYYKRRNLEAAVAGILTIGSLPRYAGHVAAVTLDSEHHTNINTDLSTGDSWYADYNPIVVREYQLYVERLFGDTAPGADSNGDAVTFNAQYGAEYVASGNALHPHASLPAGWTEVDPPRTPNPALYQTGAAVDRYWMLWTNFREEHVGAFVEEVAGWVTGQGMPPERVFSHQTSGTYQLFQNRVVPTNPPKDLAADFRAAELNFGSAGFNHYQPFNGASGYYFFPTYRRVDPNWSIPEYNPYVIQPGVTFATEAQVAADVEAAYTNGAHLICPHAWSLTDYPVVQWTSWEFQLGLQGWSTAGDLAHISGLSFTTTGLDPRLISPNALALPADSVRLVTARLRTPHQGTVVELFFERVGDSGFDASRKISVPIKGMPAGYWDGWAEYTFVVADHPLWTGTINRLRLDPINANAGTILIQEIALVKPNTFTSVLAGIVAANEGAPWPDPTPPAIIVPALPQPIAPLIGSASVEVYGTGIDGDFDPAGDFEAKTALAGGVPLARSIGAPPPHKLGQWLVGTFRLELPAQPAALALRIGLEDAAAPSNDGVRFEVTLRDEARRLWHLLDETRWDQAWSDEHVLDLAAFAGQSVTLALRTHAVADTVGDAAAWGQPRLVTAPAVGVGPGSEPGGAPDALRLAVLGSPGAQPAIEISLPALDHAARARVDLYDASGRRVRTLVDAALPSGTHHFAWDGRSAAGGRLPAGVYFAAASHGNALERGKIILVR